jgi:uncharacterized protein YjbJ (UPF0337 family)
MTELKTKEGELTTADLATYGIPQKQPENTSGEEKMLKPSTKDKVEGKLHEVKGEIKKEVGKATNNPDLEVSGKAEEKAGKIQNWIGRAEKAVGE